MLAAEMIPSAESDEVFGGVVRRDPVDVVDVPPDRNGSVCRFPHGAVEKNVAAMPAASEVAVGLREVPHSAELHE